MNIPPVTKPYFSPHQRLEKFWLFFCWAVVLVCCMLLYLYWDQTRSMDLIIKLQQFRSVPAVEYFFRFFTFLGDEQFYMIFFAILIWCIDKSCGFWAAVVLLISGLFCGTVKDLLALERPSLEGMRQLQNYAFPSGHTLMAVTVWGYLAMRLKKRWFWVWAVVAMLLIPFSRIILGYHYPGDILGGYAMGIPLLLFLVWLSENFARKGWEQRLTKASLLALSLAIPVLLTVISPQGYTPKTMGLLAGASIGYIVEKEKVRFLPRTPLVFQFLKSMIGLTVFFGLFFGLGPVFSAQVPALQITLHFFRYGLGGIWVTLLGPAVFVALKLTPSEKEKESL